MCAAKEQDLRGHLGSFGLKGALATCKMSQLSGGQAVRVGLAAVAYAEPHLLVLVKSLRMFLLAAWSEAWSIALSRTCSVHVALQGRASHRKPRSRYNK